MKSILLFIRKLLIGIGVVLMAVFYTLLSVVQTPFKALQYRKSAFALDSGAGYEAGVTDTPVYRLYNALRAQNVPIELLAHPKNPRTAHLMRGKTLIIHEIDRIAFRDGRWVIGPGSMVWKEGLNLKDAIAEILDDAFDDRPGIELDNVVILISRSSVAEPDRAENSPLFLLYENEQEQEEVLKNFCS